MLWRSGEPTITTSARPCARCKERPEHVSRTGQRRSWCTTCLNASNARVKANNPEKYTAQRRNRHLMIKYGMTADEYDALLLSQNGTCAICEKDFRDKRPHVDHDHATGRVRGLLCHWCNLMIGNAKDNVSTLQAAIRYLAR